MPTLISADHRPIKPSNRVTEDGSKLHGKLKRPRVHSRSRSASREEVVPPKFASSSMEDFSVDGQSYVDGTFPFTADFQSHTLQPHQACRESAFTSTSESTPECSQQQTQLAYQSSTSFSPMSERVTPMISAMETLALAASMLTTVYKGVSS